MNTLMRMLTMATLIAIVPAALAQSPPPAPAADAGPPPTTTATTAGATAAPGGADAAALDAANPFAQPSTLPYQLPPFDRIKESDFMPALVAGMAVQLREIAAITHDREAPSFANTVLALERSGALLGRANMSFYNLNASNGTDGLQKIESELAPLMAAHQDAINLDPALFARIDGLYQRRASLGLDPESLQLLERQHLQMVRAGASLPEISKQRLRKYNETISTLETRFSQQLIKASRDAAVVVDTVAELDGLSPAQIAAAAAAASARGLRGKWLLELSNTTTQPVLGDLRNRALRERVYRASVGRATSGALDNRPILARLVRLRAERAQLLGYANHAAYVLEDETAGTPAAADGMLRQIAGAARTAATREATQLQQLIDAQAAAAHRRPQPLQAWDWDFYAEQLRKQKYDFDEAQVKPYFELNRVLQDGVFYAAHELYGLNFKERSDLPLYGPDIRLFEVSAADGSPVGLFITDYFARDGKQGGAWMDNYVNQSRLLGQKPVVVNNLNIQKPAAGEPVLLSFDEVTTLFHEFGHALHGLLSDVQYESLSGASTARDFVEYPSQFNEMWAREPAVLAHYARHYQTGEPLPAALLARVIAAQQFNQGYASSEYLEAAAIDLALHEVTPSRAPGPTDVAHFEQQALKRLGLDLPAVPPRYHVSYFRHIFAGGYSAGYYAYIWSEVLARDTGQWFHEHGGLTRANGEAFREHVLSRGRTRSSQQLFAEFYGRAPEVGPLLDYRGLAAGQATPAP